MNTTAPPIAWNRFSTAGLPEPSRIERWEAHTEHVVYPIRCRTLHPNFNARQAWASAGRLLLTRTTGTPHVIERDAALVRSRLADCVTLHLSLRGESVFCTDDGAWKLVPGEVLVHHVDQPFLRGFARDMDDVSLGVSGSVYADLVSSRRPPLPAVVDPGSPGGIYVITLGRLLDRATREEGATAPDEEVLLELLSAVVNGGGPSLSATSHYAVACEVVERHLADPALGAEFLAARIGISTRHLSRVFAAHGTTLPRFVLHRRLDRAHRMLASGADGSPTVSEVARRCGFLSLSHFSGSFVKRYEIRPADLRRQARSLKAASS